MTVGPCVLPCASTRNATEMSAGISGGRFCCSHDSTCTCDCVCSDCTLVSRSDGITTLGAVSGGGGFHSHVELTDGPGIGVTVTFDASPRMHCLAESGPVQRNVSMA